MLRLALFFMVALLHCSCSSSESSSDLSTRPIPEQLQDLAWFTGNWVDSNSDAKVHSRFEWDVGHHFMLHTFTIAQTNIPEFLGKEIIGWDPSRKEIHSWVFDSDGGFGEGTWSEDESNWYVNMVFTMPNGQKASATNIYTKVDNSHYTFSSNNREVDGEILPNIGPITVVRQ